MQVDDTRGGERIRQTLDGTTKRRRELAEHTNIALDELAKRLIRLAIAADACRRRQRKLIVERRDLEINDEALSDRKQPTHNESPFLVNARVEPRAAIGEKTAVGGERKRQHEVAELTQRPAGR